MRAMPLVGKQALSEGGGARAAAISRLVRAALACVALILVAVAVQRVGAERQAIRALPGEERHALYARTLDELRELCSGERPALAGHCAELASFVAQFEECRGECMTLSRRQLESRPTR